MQDHNLFGIYLDILNKNQIQYFVTGSVASIVYGEPRLTHDIDLVIFLREKEVEKFIVDNKIDCSGITYEEALKKCESFTS